MQAYLIIKKMFKPQFYFLIVFYIYMSLSKPGADLASSYNDLILHFIGYAILINSSLLAYGISSKKINRFIYLFAFSFTMEIIQHFVPYREFSFLDLMANALGLFIGLIIGLTTFRLLQRTGIIAFFTPQS
jgi:VanZ family protein